MTLAFEESIDARMKAQDYRGAIEALTAHMAEPEAQTPLSRATLATKLSHCHYHLGDFPESLTQAKAAVTAAKDIKSQDPAAIDAQAGALNMLAESLERTGNRNAAIAQHLRSADWLAQHVDHAPAEALARSNAARMLMSEESGLAQAEEQAKKAHRLREGLGNQHHISTSHKNLGLILTAADRLDEARTHLETAKTLRDTLYPPHHFKRAEINEAFTGLELKAGNKEAAQQHGQAAYKGYLSHPDMAPKATSLIATLKDEGIHLQTPSKPSPSTRPLGKE